MSAPSSMRLITLSGWFLVGTIVGCLALWSQQREVTDLAFTLRVGTESGTRAFIEDELGPIPLTEGLGHDGQYSYLIARDPWGLEGLPDLADDGAYRYRRALFGWLAGGFGMLKPRSALIGLTVWSIAGLGLAAAATAHVAARLSARRWAVLGVLANLGLLLSVQLATADTLALGLAMTAVVLAVRRRVIWAILLLGLAGLAKDVYLLFAIGLAGWSLTEGDRKAALAYLLVPAIPLAMWVTWLSWQVGDGLSTKENLAMPLAGVIGSFGEWGTASDIVQSLVALVATAAATAWAVLTRHRMVLWLTLPWVAVALVSSSVVWGDGNNAVRAFAPLWLFALLGAGLWAERRSKALPA